ncbi:hypothetical protein OPT61_g3613 [Boeremia exigua]|uniref:Uncharacterized protein n=1 Tax=Boeremia exigua TaxID=749465 RepID=A0ACC2IH54_9PLEO|nr:hypothetical protein OPT61_g3613 [Boeremia exigua]
MLLVVETKLIRVEFATWSHTLPEDEYTDSSCASGWPIEYQPFDAQYSLRPKSLRKKAARYLRQGCAMLKYGLTPSRRRKPPVDTGLECSSQRISELDGTSVVSQLGCTSSLPLSSCGPRSGNEVAFIAATGISPHGFHHETSVADTNFNIVCGIATTDPIVELPATEFIPVAVYTSFPPQTQSQAAEHHKTARLMSKEMTRWSPDISSNDLDPVSVTLWQSEFMSRFPHTHFGDPPRATSCNAFNQNTAIQPSATPRFCFCDFHKRQQIRSGPRDSNSTLQQTSRSQTMLDSVIYDSRDLHLDIALEGVTDERSHEPDNCPALSNTEQSAFLGPPTPKPGMSGTMTFYGNLGHVQYHRALTPSKKLAKPQDYGGHCNGFEHPYLTCPTNAFAVDKSYTSGSTAGEHVEYEEARDKPSQCINPSCPTNPHIPDWHAEAMFDTTLVRTTSHSIGLHGIELPIRSSSVSIQHMQTSTSLGIMLQRSASTPMEFLSAGKGEYRQPLSPLPITTHHRTTTAPGSENIFCNEQDLKVNDHTTGSLGRQFPSGSSSLQQTLSS